MKITEYGTIRNASSARKKSSAGGVSNFADLLVDSENETSTAQTSSIAATPTLTGMLGLQEVSEQEISRKQLIKHGNSLLESLESLRHALLSGRLHPDVLQTLNHRLQYQRMLTADPHLHAIIDDIELRAAVELAKLEHALNAQAEQ